eukprot:107968_1
MDIIKYIDRELGSYYKDRNYFNEAHIGRFYEFCEVNAFNDGSFIEEIQQSFDDCLLIDFDEHFPIKDSNVSREQEIYNILKNIYEMYKKDTSNPLLSNKDFDELSMDEKELEHIKTIYKTNCTNLTAYKSFWDSEFADLMKLLAISHHKNVSLLQLLMDIYIRDCISQLYPLDLRQWVIARNDRKLNNRNTETISRAMQQWLTFANYRSHLSLSNQFKIQYSLQEISDKIIALILFAESLKKLQNKPFPFQMDVCFIFEDHQEQKQSDYSDDDKDNDNDMYSNTDIKANLRTNKLLFFASTIEDYKNNDDSSLLKMFQQFVRLIHTNESQESKVYPKRKRFCIIIDTRSKQDEIIFFQPTNNCSSIPTECLFTEWCFHATATYLIPEVKNNEYENKHNENIVLRNLNKKSMFSLSFHVESMDSVRCYLCINNTFCRFYPTDIVDVLSLYFDEKSDNNRRFVCNKEIYNGILKEMNKKIYDVTFEKLCNEFGDCPFNVSQKHICPSAEYRKLFGKFSKTYGIVLVDGTFRKLVLKNSEIKMNEKPIKQHYSINKDQSIDIKIYSSSKLNPINTSKEYCVEIACVTLQNTSKYNTEIIEGDVEFHFTEQTLQVISKCEKSRTDVEPIEVNYDGYIKITSKWRWV